MKSFLLRFFTWWNGQTFGTQLWTKLYGEFVGEDESGNRYYRTKDGKIDPTLGLNRRWVIDILGDGERRTILKNSPARAEAELAYGQKLTIDLELRYSPRVGCQLGDAHQHGDAQDVDQSERDGADGGAEQPGAPRGGIGEEEHEQNEHHVDAGALVVDVDRQ